MADKEELVADKSWVAAVKVEVDERKLLAMLVMVVESNTKASEKMSSEVRALRRIIAGAQEKIGGEMGRAIDRLKRTQRALDEEREEVRRAGSEAAKRGGADARP